MLFLVDPVRESSNPDSPEEKPEAGPCQQYCGRVKASTLDGSTLWVATSTHGLTVDWPADAAPADVPKEGDPAFHLRDLDVVLFGERNAPQRIFNVTHRDWSLEGMGWNRAPEQPLVWLSAVSLMLLVLTAALLVNSLAHLHYADSLGVFPMGPLMARVCVAALSLAVLLHWRLAVPGWAHRTTLGVMRLRDPG